MKLFLALCFQCFIAAFAIRAAAQDNDPQTGREPVISKPLSNRIVGKIIDKNSKPVESVSVQLVVLLPRGDSSIRGMLTRANGEFSFDDLPDLHHYRVDVSAIGFEPLSKKVDPKLTPNNSFRTDLGNLALEPAVQQLGGVTVTANRPAMEMGIDRKIYNASRNLVAAGGTAIDLMKNIPSVSVDVDGNVQLRSSTPQIFVDGRPTILTLDQIPADNIERIELITNPSARYDAASSGGIINIVLKKNKRMGLNGMLSAGFGSSHVLNSNLNLNLRQGKFNFFANAGFNQSGGKAKSEAKRINKDQGVTTDYFNQYSLSERRRLFRPTRFGTDFFIDNRNTLSFTQQIGGGHFNWREGQDQEYRDVNNQLDHYGTRLSLGKAIFRRNASILNYKHSFPKEGKELTADVTWNYGSRKELSSINNELFNPDNTVYSMPSLVETHGHTSNDQVVAQVDYVNPLTEDTRIEAGLRSYHNNFTSLYDLFAISGTSREQLPLSTHYKYTDMVNAAYVTYAGKLTGWTYQLGLRAEYSKFTGTLIDSAIKFGYEYPTAVKNIWNSLFPSVFLTKVINEKTQLQFNYSRRINRPDFWQINPSIDISDPANLRQGNINLRPEFINSFEVNYSKTYNTGNFLGVFYFRNNPDDLTEYSDTITAAQLAQLQNAAIAPNAILNTFINASTTNRYGAEFTLQQKGGANFTVTPTINLQYRTVKAKINGQDLSNQGFNWDTKLVSEYKIVTKKSSVVNNLGFQLVGQYESPEVIPQGKRKAEYSVDLAVRKDLLKNNKATIIFAVNDVFNTERSGTIYDTDNFYQDSYRRWAVRTFRITFSYKFGNADFQLGNKTKRAEGE